MRMKQTIPSSYVGLKINEWYTHIRQFHVAEAERVKLEVEREIEDMEEDQDLLLYYSLMEFRHRVMLDYIKPFGEDTSQLEFSELLEDIEGNQYKLTGLLEYYFNFFRGMYEFKQKMFVSAMMYYKRAEKNLALVSDDIEKAEFAFKMAEIFYNLKQTYVSMSYAVQALETYQMYETYTVRRIQCEFVIAGNYDDMQYPERALPHLELALDLAKKEGNPRLISSALYNLGNCYEKMGELQKAAEYFGKSVSICKSEKFDNLPHSIYSLTQVLYKQKNDAEAQKKYREGLEIARQYSDELFVELFQFLHALYGKNIDTESVSHTFQFLEEHMLYPYIEELAHDAAQFYIENGQPEKALSFYEKMVHAQKQIQRGDCLYEI
ncbi:MULTISPECIES: response regulator aspartate phosphatase RapA [Bacillaceae]|uniref:Response regulator aspartate phosphatase A n=3 Tax=Bacillus subtilis subsp. subtilis TaxID=135461 RepID=RAPA_BACSU|nr:MULTISPECIES: response regulator aspartate phosphatase RapA [Bacillales]NP_389125.1 response regulator aspartate phosphatase [Bacillus subtilis subsp. subtilis str. 168]Q00828.2 RecName: Full=Response regulator aspartate phosphatase A; AltName: Full=Glucose starvation-inducible protein A; AltName: Full=Protein-aspartate phosphatase RapA; AltName: Full=Stage 0 sporulation protein L [Bacillus subtilis subsp. subtilis str. 168]MBL3638491.1 response regulator aspartate phosphatase RapA [Alkalicoc